MADPATKRSSDSKLMITKEGKKVEQTTKLEEAKESKHTKKQQREVLEDKIENLIRELDCVWLVVSPHSNGMVVTTIAKEFNNTQNAWYDESMKHYDVAYL